MSLVLLDGATVADASGAAKDLGFFKGPGRRWPSNFTVECMIITGSSISSTVKLQGSIDGTNFSDLSSGDVVTETTDPIMFHVVNKPVRHLRINQASTSGTGTITVRVEVG